MSPNANPDNANNVWNVTVGGFLSFFHASYPFAVFPAIYLKSNILIESGKGTSINPYILKAGS